MFVAIYYVVVDKNLHLTLEPDSSVKIYLNMLVNRRSILLYIKQIWKLFIIYKLLCNF